MNEWKWMNEWTVLSIVKKEKEMIEEEVGMTSDKVASGIQTHIDHMSTWLQGHNSNNHVSSWNKQSSHSTSKPIVMMFCPENTFSGSLKCLLSKVSR